MTKASPSLKSISSQGAPFCSGGRFLEYLGILGNILQHLGKPLDIFEYFWAASAQCAGEQYLPMLTEEFAKRAFRWKKMFVKEARCKFWSRKAILRWCRAASQKCKEKIHSRILFFCVFNRFDLLSCYQPASHKAWGSIFWFFLRTKNNRCLYSWRMVQILVFCKPVSVSKCCHLFFGCPAVWNLPCSFKTIYFSQVMPRNLLNTQS